MSFNGSFCTSQFVSERLAQHMKAWIERPDLGGVIQSATYTDHVLTGVIAGHGDNEIVDMACELRDLASAIQEFGETIRFVFQYGISTLVVELSDGKARVIMDDGGHLKAVCDEQGTVT